jgi:magnesium chelatase family protein
MSFSTINSRSVTGIGAYSVCIEVHLSRGLPGFSLVGLPAKAVKESKDRVRSAIINSGFDFPAKRIVVNLAPADLPKDGGSFDLPIALGILIASQQLPPDCMQAHEAAGELALNGQIRPIAGVLPMSLAIAKEGKSFIVAEANFNEASLVNKLKVLPACDLLTLSNHLKGSLPWNSSASSYATKPIKPQYPDMQDVRDQQQAKRALEIAAAGGHSVLMVGPPGSGKTMLASRLPGLMPSMNPQQAEQTAAVYSVSHQGFTSSNWQQRPFRHPHHSASSVALVGGGNPPRPGEISLAHHGVLFLDELPEFSRAVLEALREPLESKAISIARATRSVCFPANFQLIAAMNPCPCGYYSDPDQDCSCSIEYVKKYQNKISGPLLDRFDLHLEVPRVTTSLLIREATSKAESSADICKRINIAHQYQYRRQNSSNSNLENKTLYSVCKISEDDKLFLEKIMTQLCLSARAFYRILKIARTIADLAQLENIQRTHLLEAISFHRPALGVK